MALIEQLKSYPFIMSISRIDKNYEQDFVDEYHQKLAEETELMSVLIGNVKQAVVVMITLPHEFGFLQWANFQEIVKTIHKTLYNKYVSAEYEDNSVVNFNILVTHKQSTVGVGLGKPRDTDRTNEVFYPYSTDCESNKKNLQDAFNFIHNELCLSL